MTLVRLCLLSYLLLPATSVRAAVDFNRDVRPILADRCFACHGPDSKQREAGLRLDSFQGATAVLDDGLRAIVPGQPQQSEMLARIHATDPDVVMPPPRLNRPLTTAERDLLSQWIEEGAAYDEHWAFAPPVRHSPPPVTQADWARDELDRFVLAKLEAQRLSPNPVADRATLLRRASFVLTGLPPTPEQLAAFDRDNSPDAWERQIDALLASPRYGERMAQDWLDVARFADTLGYQLDSECFVWPWRDWVIRAFNDNLSYDAFVTWQIAGDLLPDATQEQRLATLFNRLHRQTNEGGSIEQEFRQEYVSDRVHTAGTAFLGLTLECSKCHDHKYDPLPQTAYYSLCAMFGQIDECGLYPYSVRTSAAEPSLRLMASQQIPEVARRRAALEAASAAAAKTMASREQAFAAWLASTTAVPAATPTDYFPLDEIVEGRLPNAVAGGLPGSMSGGTLTPVPGAVRGAMKFDGDTVLQLDGVKGITRHNPLSISLRLFATERKERAVILHTGPATYALASDASGFELLLENGKLRWSCIFLWPGCAASIEMQADFPVGRWVDVTVTYDGSSSAAGLKIYCDGQPMPFDILHDHLDKSIVAEIMRLGARPRDDRGFADGLMDELKVFRHELSPLEVADLHAPRMATTLAAAQAGDASAAQELRTHFLCRVDEQTATVRHAVTLARRHLEDDYLHHMPLIMTMRESPHPKPFYVLLRGDYAAPDFNRPVQPAAPSAIMPFGPDLPRNRLGLARWMTDLRNPLVARVAVNRLWMQCFGAGIVVTQENFGMQGDPPSHPELLDTLAYDFSHHGWDVKALLRRILLSATFRQSSANTQTKLERDPANRWLARGPAYRLSGESIRDQALCAADRMVETIGGPSVKPWQPAGLWSDAGASGGEYTPDTGPGLYRRSLYTYRKRTAPPPSMITLDGGSREVCQPRRLTTNTPLQPLIFLNDQSFFECARLLAQRVRRECPADSAAQLRRAFLLLTSREPAAEELDALRDLVAQQRVYFTAHPAAATAVCGADDVELAALTIVCSTLLTSDATITTR